MPLGPSHQPSIKTCSSWMRSAAGKGKRVPVHSHSLSNHITNNISAKMGRKVESIEVTEGGLRKGTAKKNKKYQVLSF